MHEELPKGWVITTLGEIIEPSRARALPAEVPDMPYVGLEHIEAQTMKLLGHGYAREIRSSSVRFSKGDVLYGKMRPYLNKVWVAGFEGLCSAEFLVFPKRDVLNNQFLALRLNAEDFMTFANGQVSGERPRVDFEKLSRFSILLPPAAEQERIVDKLNAALSAIERAEKAARRAQGRLNRYRAAVLDAAVTGELTSDWRKTQQESIWAKAETGEVLLEVILKARSNEWRGKGKYEEPTPPVAGILPKPPEGWTIASLEQLTSANRVICYGILMPKEHIPDGIPYVKVRDMKGDKIDINSLSRTSPEIASKYARAALKPGDVLLAIRGTYGRVVEVPPELDGGNITQDTARLAFTTLVDWRYVVLFLRSQHAQNYFNRVARGVAVKGVNIADVRACPVLLPPLVEQTLIVEEVERRLLAANRLASALEQQLARIPRQSLLREAFAGRVVPQDPNDEPASALLERIRAVRAAEVKKPRAEHMPRSKSKSKAVRRSLIDVLREHKKPMTPEQLFMASGYRQEFEENECRQEIVDSFYEELRQLVGPKGPVWEKRPSRNTVLLEVRS